MGNSPSDMYDFINNDTMVNTNATEIIATGDWRNDWENRAAAAAAAAAPKAKSDGYEPSTQFDRLKVLLKNDNSFSQQLLTQQDEGIKQARCCHRYMKEYGYISSMKDNTDEDALFLYIGAGRGSTQITLIDENDKVIQVYKEKGYPRKGEPPIEALSKICEEIKRVYEGRIVAIFGFDSIFHVLKKDCPVVKEGDILPEVITTTGSDFEKLGYLANHFSALPMIVFRYFKMTNSNDIFKISFLEGDELKIDLGSGEAKLIDPSNGNIVYKLDLPDNWQTCDKAFTKMYDILTSLNDIKYDYENYDSFSIWDYVPDFLNWLKPSFN